MYCQNFFLFTIAFHHDESRVLTYLQTFWMLIDTTSHFTAFLFIGDFSSFFLHDSPLFFLLDAERFHNLIFITFHAFLQTFEVLVHAASSQAPFFDSQILLLLQFDLFLFFMLLFINTIPVGQIYIYSLVTLLRTLAILEDSAALQAL